jgi:predicted glycosyltransferase
VRVGFLVQNGIGLGHVRRALLIAEALRELKPEVEPVIVSQAQSTELLHRAGVRAINLPVLHRLPNNTVARSLQRILDGVLARLELDLLVEDTEPDSRYRRVPAYRELPSVFVLRRVDAIGFDRLRRTGAFEPVERVMVTDSRTRLLAEEHTPASRLALRWSRRFRFVGPVYAAAASPRRSRPPSVVVSAGGGGDHFDEAFSERLFLTAGDLAAAMPETAFTLVIGPYYAGRSPQPAPNVRIVRFAHDLPALLGAARVAVIRPGHNVLYEALAGHPFVVLVPAPSHMEAQRERAFALASEYPGVGVADLDRPYELEALLRRELAAESNGYLRSLPPPGQREIAQVVLEELSKVEERRSGRTSLRQEAFVAVRPAVSGIPDGLPAISQLRDPADAAREHALLETSDLLAWSPKRLRAQGIELVLGATEEPAAFDDWCRHYTPETESLLAIGVERIRSHEDAPSRVLQRIEHAAGGGSVPAVVLDVAGEHDPERAARIVDETARRLRASGCRLLTIEELASRVVEQRHLRPTR